MRLAKHHGLGNDFLVLLDPDGATPVDADLARALCDRRTGVGADGLLWAGPGANGADVTMTLHNADGSRAEMSGNGIRCLAHAVARSRGTAGIDLLVSTDAGLRRAEVRPGPTADVVDVRVSMGAVTEAPATDLGLGAKEQLGASVGNPHVVALFADRESLDAAADGFARAGTKTTGSASTAPNQSTMHDSNADPVVFAQALTDRNVEFVVAGPGEDELTMRVVERGVGETRACGTGACAAAWAGNRWHLVGERVTVHMPGGAAVVELGDEVHLVGPSVHVADIRVQGATA